MRESTDERAQMREITYERDHRRERAQMRETTDEREHKERAQIKKGTKERS
jgi:hypothetical protein